MEIWHSLINRIAFRLAMVLALLIVASLMIAASQPIGTQNAQGAIQATLPPPYTYHVNTVEDEPPEDRPPGYCGNPCTLRGAVAASNHEPGGRIILSSGTYTLTYGSLVTEKIIEIVGDGADVTNIHVEFQPFNIFSISDDSRLTLNDVALTGGIAVTGGAIENHGDLTLIRTLVTENDATVGGGIWNVGTLTLIDSTVRHNTASEGVGGIENYGTTNLVRTMVTDNNGAAGAGGICNHGTLNVYGSTIDYNIGRVGGVQNSGELILDSSKIAYNEGSGNGGGLYSAAGHVQLINSTLSGNLANNGGGIYNQGPSTIWVTSATVANNSATHEGGGISTGTGAGFILRNTILSANEGGNCHGIFGSVINTLVSSNDCNLTGTVIVADPLLGDLQDNGGPTATHALLKGSPALNAVPAADCVDFSGQPLLTDQRGMPRLGGDCDIGAFELTYNQFLPLLAR